MKIGITCYPTYGGSGVVATELGIELAAKGHQVALHHLPAAIPADGPGARDLLPRGGGAGLPAV